MASKFLTTDIIDPVKAPITGKGLQHVNAMSQEIGDAFVKSCIGTYTTNDIIVLSGCVVTVLSGSVPGTGTASLSAGYVYRNGEVYAVDAIASVATTANTLVWVADDELRDSVQTKFSNGTDYNFLRIAKLKLQSGASGSGLNDFDASTVKNIVRSQNIAAGVDARINGRSVTINFIYQTSSTLSFGNNVGWTIPSNLRTRTSAVGGYVHVGAYLGGGGTNQFNLSTAISVNTVTGAVTMGLDMPTGTDVLYGQFTYYID